MARVFVTGSADGFGQKAARLMVEAGHRVVLQARSRERAADALAAIPGAETAVVGDLSQQLRRAIVGRRLPASCAPAYDVPLK